MKRKSYDDNQIQKLVEKLPSIEDKQSKEQLYENIEKRMNDSRRKKPQWVVPAFASIAVIVVMIMIIPSVWNSMNGQFQSLDGIEESESTQEGSSADSEGENQSASLEGSAEDKAITSEVEKQQIGEETVDRMSSSKSDGRAAVYFDTQAQIVIPVTWMSGDDVAEADLKEIAKEKYGLIAPTGEYSFSPEEDSLVVEFPNEFRAEGSATENSIVQDIQWRAYAEDAREIFVRSQDGNAVNLGNRGQVTQLDTIQEASYIYQLFTSATGERFLVPVPFEGSIQEAVRELKENLGGTSASVPDSISFIEVEGQSDRLYVRVEEDSWKSPQEKVTAIESILLTAKQYGFEEVQLEGITPTEDSVFAYDKPIQVPELINPIQP
ncbi:hypothetical protein [Halobacillus salinus]|uniref:hypothetical protein n=1 Tax=Halobacillus salinus TaxID=192814 RepID=UPI0009A856C7|nr:hypothetical protein [Halobacillus salinus]